jgi:hypothetical protein
MLRERARVILDRMTEEATRLELGAGAGSA